MKRECPEEERRARSTTDRPKRNRKNPGGARLKTPPSRWLARVLASVNREGFRNRRAGPISGTDPAGVFGSSS